MVIIFMRWWLMMLEVVEMFPRAAAGPRWPGLLGRTAGLRLCRGRETSVLFEAMTAVVTAMVVMEAVAIWRW